MQPVTTASPKPATTTIGDEKILEDFNKKVNYAIESNDPVKIAKAQLEVSWAQMQYLQRIDWKMWELYNLFINK